MGDELPLEGFDIALFQINPGVKQYNLRHQTLTSLQKDRLCVVSNYFRQEVRLFKRITEYLKE